MPDFRAYIIGHDGHFCDVVNLVCNNDEEAKQKAERLVDGHAVELWLLDRKIQRFEPPA